MEIFGLDIHGEDYGIPTVGYDVAGSFDLICFFDSLEHFQDFSALLELRTRNVVVSIPESPDLLLKNPKVWRHYRPGEHLHYFSHDSLDRLMQRWGFPQRIAAGFPEDDLRGKLRIGARTYDNIYTAIYSMEASR